ncbi:type IV secretion system protein VirJ [Polymorphobacter arshaanensis]|uniref:Type IV secretion system protein VirJ n=1 Tax=Glacieibacterium arshaanense TaxID=2511025 RepID=A0A4Y9ENE4_9SPHN|nr:AcvB/VirJ family lysyl-phosphatidylglycerol hydrolase [Polymorphobacter arshaanensis]TFU03557.1 type IV secretion system protein VirJ [Polymorphobacter arshaanensis]
MSLLALASAAAIFSGFGYFGGPTIEMYPAASTHATAAGHAGVAAVVLSSDMGLNAGMGGELAKSLAADGIPVVGFNSLAFFKTRRTPTEVVTMVEAVTRKALALPGIKRVVLIGQSFGADVLPTGLDGLPAALRPNVMLVGLIVPSETITYKASPAEIFTRNEPAFDAAPAARALNWVPVLCISGAQEDHSLCPALNQPNVRRIAMPGGHLLDRNAAAVYKQLIAAIEAANANVKP